MSVQSVRKALGLCKVPRQHFLNHWEGRGYPTNKVDVARYVNETFRLWEFYTEMAKKTAGALPQRKAEQATFKGFVNYVLSDADKIAFKSWEVDDSDLWTLLASCLCDGYKVSSSYNQQNDTFSASFLCTDVASPNAGLLLSAYAPDPYYAVKSLVYKHLEILKGDWTSVEVKEQNKWG